MFQRIRRQVVEEAPVGGVATVAEVKRHLEGSHAADRLVLPGLELAQPVDAKHSGPVRTNLPLITVRALAAKPPQGGYRWDASSQRWQRPGEPDLTDQAYLEAFFPDLLDQAQGLLAQGIGYYVPGAPDRPPGTITVRFLTPDLKNTEVLVRTDHFEADLKRAYQALAQDKRQHVFQAVNPLRVNWVTGQVTDTRLAAPVGRHFRENRKLVGKFGEQYRVQPEDIAVPIAVALPKGQAPRVTAVARRQRHQRQLARQRGAPTAEAAARLEETKRATQTRRQQAVLRRRLRVGPVSKPSEEARRSRQEAFRAISAWQAEQEVGDADQSVDPTLVTEVKQQLQTWLGAQGDGAEDLKAGQETLSHVVDRAATDSEFEAAVYAWGEQALQQNAVPPKVIARVLREIGSGVSQVRADIAAGQAVAAIPEPTDPAALGMTLVPRPVREPLLTRRCQCCKRLRAHRLPFAAGEKPDAWTCASPEGGGLDVRGRPEVQQMLAKLREIRQQLNNPQAVLTPTMRRQLEQVEKDACQQVCDLFGAEETEAQMKERQQQYSAQVVTQPLFKAEAVAADLAAETKSRAEAAAGLTGPVAMEEVVDDEEPVGVTPLQRQQLVTQRGTALDRRLRSLHLDVRGGEEADVVRDVLLDREQQIGQLVEELAELKDQGVGPEDSRVQNLSQQLTNLRSFQQAGRQQLRAIVTRTRQVQDPLIPVQPTGKSNATYVAETAATPVYRLGFEIKQLAPVASARKARETGDGKGFGLAASQVTYAVVDPLKNTFLGLRGPASVGGPYVRLSSGAKAKFLLRSHLQTPADVQAVGESLRSLLTPDQLEAKAAELRQIQQENQILPAVLGGAFLFLANQEQEGKLPAGIQQELQTRWGLTPVLTQQLLTAYQTHLQNLEAKSKTRQAAVRTLRREGNKLAGYVLGTNPSLYKKAAWWEAGPLGPRLPTGAVTRQRPVGEVPIAKRQRVILPSPAAPSPAVPPVPVQPPKRPVASSASSASSASVPKRQRVQPPSTTPAHCDNIVQVIQQTSQDYGLTLLATTPALRQSICVTMQANLPVILRYLGRLRAKKATLKRQHPARSDTDLEKMAIKAGVHKH